MKSKRKIKWRPMDNIGKEISYGGGELGVLRHYEDTVLIYKVFKT